MYLFGTDKKVLVSLELRATIELRTSVDGTKTLTSTKLLASAFLNMLQMTATRIDEAYNPV